MRVLITGSNGFVGRHLIEALSRAGHTPVGFDLEEGGLSEQYCGDIRNEGLVREVVRHARPDGCVHLAGIAYVPKAWEDPQLTFSINVMGTINILQSFKTHCPRARVLVASTAQIYGNHLRERPVREDDPLMAGDMYSVFKAASDQFALLYAKRYDIPHITLRPENHIGPGQSDQFVIPSLTRQLVKISLGHQENVVRVGNLESQRSFVDVRDVVRAYVMLLEKGRAACAYNISAGRNHTIASIFDRLCGIVGVRPRVEVDPALYRPADVAAMIDTTRIRQDVGWEPQVTLQQSLVDIVADMRARENQ